MIEICNIKKSYNDKLIINIENLKISSTGILYIFGESGAGKTTLINCLFGLDSFDAGDIFVNGKKVKNLKEYASFVFQDFQLIDKWTVKQNLLLSREDCKESEIDEILTKLNILDIKNNLSFNISAGQKQRVAIARALLINRPIVILDEPFSNLDKKNYFEILDIFKNLSKEKLFIIITHENLNKNDYSQKVEIKNGHAYSTSCSRKDEIITTSVRKDLSLKKVFKLTCLFMKKCKQTILSIIALVLCFSFLFLELEITMKNPSDQAYHFYQTSHIDYVNFCSYSNDDYLAYLSYEGEIEENSFKTINHLALDMIYNENTCKIESIWAKNINIDDDSIILSSDLIEKLDIDYNDYVDFLGYKYKVVKNDITSYAMKNSLITSIKNYEQMIIRSYNLDPTLDTNYGYISLKTYKEAGIDNFSDGHVSISTGLKSQIEFKLNQNIFSDDSLTISIRVNNYHNKYGNEKVDENIIIGDVISDNDRIIYCDDETYDRLCRSYSSSSILNGLVGYGYINPSSGDFSRAYNKGLIDFSPISESLIITNEYLESWNVIFIPISIVLFAIALIVMIICINNSISLNTKELGILLSLDYSRKNFYKILILETLFISFISICLAVPLGIVITELFNLFLRHNFLYAGSALYIVWFIPFVEFAITLLLLVFYICLINFKLLKKSNIEIIYGK